MTSMESLERAQAHLYEAAAASDQADATGVIEPALRGILHALLAHVYVELSAQGLPNREQPPNELGPEMKH